MSPLRKLGWGMVPALVCPVLAHALSATVIGSFSPGVGPLEALAVDHATGNIYAFNQVAGIRILQPDGTPLGQLTMPGHLTNDVDMDFALRDISIGGQLVPAGTLLAFNGDDAPEMLYGLDPVTGAVLASVPLETVSLVGGADAPALNAVVTIDYTTDTVRIIDPDDGHLLRVVTPQLPFDVFYGDIDYVTESDRLLVASSYVPYVRELDVDGYCMRDIDVSHAGITEIAGIAVDESRGDYWFSTVNGSVYRVRLDPTLVDTDGDGVLDEDDNCINAANPDQTDADGDGIGNQCDADLNNDCIVNFQDLGALQTAFFSSDPVADLNADGSVNFGDLGIMKNAFFLAPGPSGEGGPCGCGL